MAFCYNKFLILNFCENGDIDMVSSMIKKYPHLINCSNSYGMTPLIISATRGWKTLVILLLDKGSFIDKKDSTGSTALIRASSKGYNDIIDILLMFGANIYIENNLRYTYITIKDLYLPRKCKNINN
jgi:ankyrin repeat protein